jgi:hypothetical protein
MADPPTAERAPEGGITITRIFDAPREGVWREWADPEAFADWFGGSESEVPLSTVSMDVRPGGSWRLTMFADPGRREIHWKGEYLEASSRSGSSSRCPTSRAMKRTSSSRSSSPTSATAEPRCSSSSEAACPQRCTSKPGGDGPPFSTASLSASPTADPSAAPTEGGGSRLAVPCFRRGVASG